MKNLINEYFEIELRGEIAILFFKGNIFELLMSDEYSIILYEALASINSNSHIKILLTHNIPNVFGNYNYNVFINNIISEDNTNNSSSIKFSDKNSRFKEIYVLNNFVIFLSNYNKICVNILSGEITTPIFGISMTADFRYATDDMKFVLSNKQFGLHPSGGLPFFLSNEFGHSKAMELLLLDEIPLKEALKLGLICKNISADDYLSWVINDLNEIINTNGITLRKTKQLTSFNREPIKEYFAFENTILNLH